MTAPPPLVLDHVVLAGPDLEEASRVFAERTGVAPAPGGPHTGLGTRNALASLGDDVYIELIAPDPATANARNLGGRLATLDGLDLFTWALRSSDLPALGAALARADLEPSAIFETRRDAPDGERLVWDLMGLPGRGGAWPFFIDWRDCLHPARTQPVAGALQALEVSLPAADPERLPFDGARQVTLAEGPAALALTVETPAGTVRWHACAPRGFYA
ncbi:MAG: VOC family protein [Myxococcota bacterium]